MSYTHIGSTMQRLHYIERFVINYIHLLAFEISTYIHHTIHQSSSSCERQIYAVYDINQYRLIYKQTLKL